MKVALIGPPQSGKSTIFAAVTGQAIDPALAMQERLVVVKVPDPRLTWLTALYKRKKTVEATIDFVDLPGISLADAHGQAELKRHLPTIRQADGLVAVVRAFRDDSVSAYRNRIDPRADLDELHAEFLFADLDAVTNRLERLKQSEAKKNKLSDEEKRERALLERCRTVLETDRPLSEAIEHEEDKKLVSSFQFLTEKPFIVVINVAEADAARPPAFQYEQAFATLALSARTEAEIAWLEPEDRAAFLADLGVEQAARDRLLKSCYDAVGLISFLTVGQDEVRAWPIRKHTIAVDAAGKVHTDIAKGFIRAETVAYEDLKAAGDMKTAKAHAKVRLEGKTYEVKDGDVINFRFNI